MENNKTKYIWGLLRIGMGWIFFWAFIDKLFGLGFATTPEKAWIEGGSPTFGFLSFATKGPFTEFYKNLAGNPVVDWLFMLGLFFVGVTLLLGIFVKLGSYTGVLMLILMYTAGFILPVNNPFLDDHIIYTVLMIGFTISQSGYYLGFGKLWSKTKLIQKYNIFE